MKISKKYIILTTIIVAVVLLLIGIGLVLNKDEDRASLKDTESFQSESEEMGAFETEIIEPDSQVQKPEPEQEPEPEKTPETENTPEITPDSSEENLDAMSLEEKIYQMMVLMPAQFPEKTLDLVKYPVGGVLYMASDLQNPGQTKAMIEDAQKQSLESIGLPLFICVDEEGGRVARIANNGAFGVTNVGPMSQITDADKAYQAGETMGAYLSDLGFNWDFAPVADVITNPFNTVIGDRSFGTDALKVKEFAVAVSKGLQAKGLMTTFKHFPGHGATEGDTHEGFAYTNKTYEELLKQELVPFAVAQEEGVDAIMIAHISLPKVIGDNTPCTLSYRVVTEILRGDLGYEGLVVTDAMNMGAITKVYSCGEAAIKAVEAGCDIILAPTNLLEAVQAIKVAVENGTLTETRIDESVRRILAAKDTIQ